MKEVFEQWLKDNDLSFENEGSVYFINEKTFLLLEHKNDKIINYKFSLILSDEEKLSLIHI